MEAQIADMTQKVKESADAQRRLDAGLLSSSSSSSIVALPEYIPVMLQ